jgi:hypothetical protein
MRNRVIGTIVVLVLVLAAAFSWVSIGKTTAKAPQIVIQPVTPNPEGRAGGGRAARTPPPPSAPHDPKELNGVWAPGGGGFGGPGAQTLADASVRTGWMNAPLPLTAAGMVAINANHGGKGPRSYAPSAANDPIGDANPPGLVRTFVYGRATQFIQLPNQLVNLFEWYHYWRQVWLDGRKLPEDPDALWYGYSVGAWKGDHLSVDTVGLETRNWLDMWGAPESDAMKVNEDWHRMDTDNMEFVISFNDPKFYTKPWSGDKRIWRLQPKGKASGELYEDIFAPWDEQDFNKRIRDPNPLTNGGHK